MGEKEEQKEERMRTRGGEDDEKTGKKAANCNFKRMR